MESNLSCLSSLEEDYPDYIQPHYKESYRLAIYALLCGGKEAYEEFLRAEQINHFLSEEETVFILENAEVPVVEDDSEGRRSTDEVRASTYFPIESDEEVPDLDLGWPEIALEGIETSISLLFHPPRQNTPTIKEVVRKQIQAARKLIAIVMDVFTDGDIFKELINAIQRGVVVYILLDDSHVKSFLKMAHNMEINIQELKNLRVRTVQGPEYQCRSGFKFHGGLEQKFILVDCQTVMYGTYSYTWIFEKINLSMVLVVTGQLVSTYDEEFRRLYARSTTSSVLLNGRPPVLYLKDTLALESPNSSQLSLNMIHRRSRVMHGMRSAQDNRFNNSGTMTRGLSVQDRLHQYDYTEMGNLVKGHSYGGELQKVNSMTRLRMGTKDIGVPGRSGSKPRGGGEALLPNRMSHHHLRHQTRYGADQNLIPFNSETSLHRWKIDSYLNENEMRPDASCDAISPVTSPYSSHTGLNDYQSQLIHSRSRDIKSRMEETRQKRFSLQDYSNFRQSQESLRSMYLNAETSKLMSSLRGLDVRQSITELEPVAQESCSQENRELKKRGNKREPLLTDGQRPASHHDVVSDGKTMQTYDCHEPLSKTTSAADLDQKMSDAPLKLSHLQSSSVSIQHPRAMESLTEVPEDKDTHLDPALKVRHEICKDEELVPKNSVKSPEREIQDQAAGKHYRVAKSTGSGAPRQGKQSISNEAETSLEVFNPSTGPQQAVEDKGSHTEKGETQPEDVTLQRKHSMKMKVPTSDEKKISIKEEKSLQRRTSGVSQPLKAAHSLAPDAVHTTKSQLLSMPSLQSSLTSSSETEKNKSPLSRFSPQRLSKKKMALAAEQDSKGTLGDERETLYQRPKDKAYSRYEFLLSNENLRLDKSKKKANSYSSDKERISSLHRRESGRQVNQTQSSSDNKLERFMQRVGNLINKNK
ncbi:zinc finger and BTB domain-containing protein 40 [Sarotherodon galilaeus]